MEFKEFKTKIQELGKTVKDRIQPAQQSEEATKLYLIAPFLRLLGYDTENPEDVHPEFVADIAGKQGEKIDYCIRKNGQGIILVECKCCDKKSWMSIRRSWNVITSFVTRSLRC